MGALPRGRGPVRGPRSRLATPREAGRAGRAVVGRGAAQRRPAARQPRLDAIAHRSPTASGAARATATFRAVRRCPSRWPSSVRNRSHQHRGGHRRTAGASCPTVAFWLSAVRWAGGRCTWSTVGFAMSTISTANGGTTSPPRRPSETVAISSSSTSRRTTSSAGSPPCSKTARRWARAFSTGSPRSAFNEVGAGLTCGYEWGPAVGGGYEAPFTFNGTILRAEVTATGPVTRDPVAEGRGDLVRAVVVGGRSAGPPGNVRPDGNRRSGEIIVARVPLVLIVIGSIKAREDTIERIQDLALAHVHRSRQEPGCLLHTVHTDVEDPLRLVFVEHWTDDNALRAHFGAHESGQFVRTASELRGRGSGDDGLYGGAGVHLKRPGGRARDHVKRSGAGQSLRADSATVRANAPARRTSRGSTFTGSPCQ